MYQQPQVQPRPCGEYSKGIAAAETTTGSTPPVRGICTILDSASNSIRFNPARAGNIEHGRRESEQLQVQPRPCGEYNSVASLYVIFTGSTPPVRGIYFANDLFVSINRFNPARAGNISTTTVGVKEEKVQPRPCGEYISWELEKMQTAGSTPPVQGIFCETHGQRVNYRFNPARAGNINT